MTSPLPLFGFPALLFFLPLAASGQAVPPGIPQITTAPTGGTRSAGVSSTLTVIATGNATLTYQWLRGTSSSPTVEIAGATGANFTLASPTAADTAYYSVRVSNSLGSLTTEPVLVAYEQSAGGLARTDLPTSYIASGSQVNAVIPEADGSYVIGGNFTAVSGIGMNGLARIATNGFPEELYFPKITVGSGVTAMVRDSSGRILLGGSAITEITDGFPSFMPYTRYGLARILANGTLDAGFNSPCSAASSAFTNAIAVESSGTVLVGGTFSNVIGMTGTKYLLRLNGTTGATDATFSPSLSSAVNAIHVLADGKIMVGHGTGLILLESTGSPATGFTYGGGTTAVNAIQPLPGGDFLIGRSGTTGNLIRITSAGTLVAPFPATGTAANNSITEILALPSGNFIIGGLFTAFNGTNGVNRVAHITADGTPASGYSFGTGFGNSVTCLALDPSNNLWVGGTFTTYRSQDRRKLACLSTTTVTATDPGAPAPDAYTQYLIDAGIAAVRRGTADDPDGDGSSNMQEFQNATDPSNPASASLRLTATGIGATLNAVPSSASGTYAPNTSVELTVTPDPGNTFLGWAPTGSSPADTTNPLTVVMNQNRTLTAYAGLPIGEALDAPSLTWTTGGNVLWRGVTSPSHNGGDSIIVSGLTAAGQESWVETTVNGIGVLALRWTLNTAVANAATLQVLENGSQIIQTLASTTGGYQSYAIKRQYLVPTTLRIRLTGNAGISPGDTASIDLFHYGPQLVPVLLPPTNLIATSATLNWGEVPGNSGYDIQVATNPSFTGIVQYYWADRDKRSQAIMNLNAGTSYHYRITAYGPQNVAPTQATGTFTAPDRQAQTIDFPQPAAKTFGDPPFALSATATSGLPVTFELVSGPGSLAGGNLTLTGGGNIVLRASQAGNANYFAATPVERTLTVAPAAQTLTFAQPPDLPADPLAYHALAASASSGLPITFTVDSGPATIIDGMLRLTGTGVVRITASQPGNANYLAAAPVTRESTAVAPAAATPMKLSGLGKLPGGSSGAAKGISGDGSTIVGWATNSASNNEAFRGSPAAGITGLGDLSGGSFTSWANAVSQNGSVVVGYSSSASGTEAFRWTSAGMVGLGDLPGGSFNSWANAVSQDGSVVVGMGQNSSFFNEAFRWTQADGMLPIGILPGGNSSEALGVSGDGNTVVGVSSSTGITEMAFRWVAVTGMTALGDLPGGETRSRANAISADGTVIVGQSTSANGREAFRWTTADGMVGLGDLPGGTFESESLAVSADGSVVVGRATVTSGYEAFIWDAAHGMRSIRDVLTAAGLATGRKFYTATGISADGRFVTGSGTARSGASEAWLLDLNAPFVPATVALLWTEDLPQTEPFKANNVVRMSFDNGTGKTDLATQLGGVNGGFNGVEYADGKILVPNQATTLGTRIHHPAYSSRLVTNVFGYDLDARPGELWRSNGNARQIFHSQPSGNPTNTGGIYDDTYTPISTTNVGRFAFAIQAVDSTVYFSNPSDNPTGIFKMNTDGTGITPVHTAGSPVVYDFEVVGGMIYFCNIATNSIQRINTDGGGLVTLVANADFPNGIDVTADGIYWTEWQNGRIRRSDLNGGNVTELITDLYYPRGVVVMPLSFVVPTDPLSDFLANAGVPADQRGAGDDPDHDGAVNLVEYALDLLPNTPSAAALPRPVAAAGQLSLTYRRVRSDVTYTVQVSPTLADGSWTSVGVNQGLPAPDGTTTASIPLGGGKQFLRLSLTLKP
jgi:probable HAF family extracellular repeat protein